MIADISISTQTAPLTGRILILNYLLSIRDSSGAMIADISISTQTAPHPGRILILNYSTQTRLLRSHDGGYFHFYPYGTPSGAHFDFELFYPDETPPEP